MKKDKFGQLLNLMVEKIAASDLIVNMVRDLCSLVAGGRGDLG